MLDHVQQFLDDRGVEADVIQHDPRRDFLSCLRTARCLGARGIGQRINGIRQVRSWQRCDLRAELIFSVLVIAGNCRLENFTNM